MSLHEINLQKLRQQLHAGDGDVASPKNHDVPPTPFIAFPSTTNNTMILAGALSGSRFGQGQVSDDDDDSSVGDVSQHTTKSWWADISEVDSMAASRKSSMSVADVVDTDHEEEKKTSDAELVRDTIDATTPRCRNVSPASLQDEAMPLRVMQRQESSGYYVSEQSCGDSTVEEGSIASVQSGSGYSANSSHLNKMNPRQRYRYLMKQAQDQAEQARAELEIVQQQLATLEKRQLTEMDEIKRDMIKAQANEHELRMEIKSTESEYKMVRDRLLQTVSENKELNATIAQQNEAMASQEKEHRSQMQDLEAKLTEAKRAKATAEAKLEKALEKIKVLQEDIATATPSKNVRFAPPSDNQVVVFHSTDYASQLKASQNLNKELQLQLRELQHDMEALEEEHTSLKQLQRDSSTDHQNQLRVEKKAAQDARAQVSDLLSSLVQMQENADHIEQERMKLQEQLEQAHGTREDAESMLKKKDKDMARIEREVFKIREAMSSLQSGGDTMSATPTKEAPKRGSGEDLLYQLEKTRFRLEKQASAIQQERKSLQTAASDATSRFNRLNDHLFMIEMEKKELLQQLDGLKMKVTALRKESSRLTAEKNAMEQALKEQQSLLESSEARVSDLELERASLQEELAALQQRVSNAKSLRLIRNSGDDELRHRMASVQADLAAAESNLVEQREQLREQVDLVHRLEAQLKKVQRELDVTRKDKAAMEKAHAIAMEEHAQARKEAEARVLEAQRQIEELQMLQSDTQQQLAEEKAVLHDQMEQMSQQLFHAQVEKEQLLDQLACMDSMIKEHQDKAKTYADLEDIIAQRDKLQQQLNESNALVMSLREQLKNNKCEVVELQKQTMELQGVEAALTEQLHSLQCDLDAANEALGAANSKIALLEQEQTELQVSLSEAKVSIKMLEQTNKALLVESAEMKLKYDETFFELQAEKNAALSELAEAQSESKSLEITVETLTSSRIMLQSKVDETTELWAEAKDQFRMKSKELEGVRGELDDLKQGNILLQGQVNETIFEKELLSKKLEEASHEASELHLEVVLLGQRNNALEESKVNIERRVVFLEHDVATLKGSLETSATEYEKSLEEKTLMVTMASEKASKAEAERNALHVKVQSLQQEQNWLQDKLAETEALWKDATSQFRLKQKLIKDLEKKLLASEESRANLEAVKKELTAQLDALSKSDSVQNASRCRFETEMKLSATNIRLSMAHCEEQKTREHLVQEKRSFEALSKSDDILRTKEEMNTLQQQLNHTKESLAALQSENVNLKTELELTTAALAEAEQQKEASLKATEELRQERDQAVVAKVALQMVTEDLQEKLDTQSKKVKKLAKLLKRVLEQNSMPTGGVEMDEGSAVNREGRVSRLPITLKLRYRDRVTGAINKMEVSAEYSGPLVDGKPEGPGVLRFECGDVYLGEFKQGEMDGVGSYVRKRPPQEGDNLCLSGMFACNSYVLPLSPTSSSSSS